MGDKGVAERPPLFSCHDYTWYELKETLICDGIIAVQLAVHKSYSLLLQIMVSQIKHTACWIPPFTPFQEEDILIRSLATRT